MWAQRADGMSYIITALGLLLGFTLWGLGLAWLAVPARWRWCRVAFAPAAGMALQSAVVWLGALLDLPGTDSYAVWSLLVPIALLAWAGRQSGWLELVRALVKWWAVGAIMVCSLCLLALPLAWRSDALTTSSLGSCDAADYAAGARVFKEFAASDRSGFLGLTEVVSVGSADNFYDFWLKLNHFTPSALIALNGSILGLEPYELTSVLTLVLLVLGIPAVFVLARSLFAMRTGPALWLAGVYGISPITWYASYQVATAQLIAATAIGWVTWWAVAMWNGRHRGAIAREVWPALVISLSLLWGAYNFIVVVCLLPAVAIAGGRAIWTGAWAELLRWSARLFIPLLISALFYFSRAEGLVERFLLFSQTDFGWKIPALMPEGWLGIVRDIELNAWRGNMGVALSVLTVASIAVAWCRSMMRRRMEAWSAPAVIAPVLCGYLFLQWRGLTHGTNASYDAYKLLAVFYPVLLGALCVWLRWLGEGLYWRIAAVLLMAGVTWGNGLVATQFAARMAVGPLVVTDRLIELQRIETMSEVRSVNLRVPEMWERLWANQFLLRKAQYFQTHSYEGRLDTPLRGEWDLNGGLVHVRLPQPDSIAINDRFALARCDSPWHVRAEWGNGWHGPETLHARRKVRWNWSGPKGELRVHNDQTEPLYARLHLLARGLRQQQIVIQVHREERYRVEVGAETERVISPAFRLPPGEGIISVRATGADRPHRGGDSRLLGVAVYEVVLEVLPSEPVVLE